MTQVLRVGVRELRGNLTSYLRQAQQGTSILVTSHDQVIAELRPPPVEQRPRRMLGAMRGKIWVAPDFDEWPPGFVDVMEGKEDAALISEDHVIHQYPVRVMPFSK